MFRFLAEIVSFSFSLVNSEYDAFPPVDHSIVHSHSKMFLLFSSILLSLKPSSSIHILVSFCLLIPDLPGCRIWILLSTFPSLQIFFFHFWFTINASPSAGVIIICFVSTKLTTKFGSLSARMFLFCFCPWRYTLNVKISSRESADVFGNVAHVFCNLFLKICPLFG